MSVKPPLATTAAIPPDVFTRFPAPPNSEETAEAAVKHAKAQITAAKEGLKKADAIVSALYPAANNPALSDYLWRSRAWMAAQQDLTNALSSSLEVHKILLLKVHLQLSGARETSNAKDEALRVAQETIRQLRLLGGPSPPPALPPHVRQSFIPPPDLIASRPTQVPSHCRDASAEF